jgi:hypothetical protein
VVGLKPTVSSGAQVVTVGVTATSTARIPSRIACATPLAAVGGRSSPPVSEVIAPAWPSASSPPPVVPAIGTAITRTPLAFSASIAAASGCSMLGSCERASPNHATMRVLFGRNSTASVPIRQCALMKSVHGEPPPPTWSSQSLTPVSTWLSSAVRRVFT